MNVNWILFLVLTALLIIALFFESYHLPPNGKYSQIAKVAPGSTPQQVKNGILAGLAELQNPVIWRRTIIATWLFFVVSYVVLLSIQTSFGTTDFVSNFPWVVIVILAFISFYLVQNFFNYHHSTVVANEIRKNVDLLV
jgi:hypothetical protein